MSAIDKLNNTAARATRKAESAQAIAEKAFDKLDDVARVLYKRVNRRSDPDALASLGTLAATLDGLAIRAIVGAESAHHISTHARNVHTLLQRKRSLRRPQATTRQKQEGPR